VPSTASTARRRCAGHHRREIGGGDRDQGPHRSRGRRRMRPDRVRGHRCAPDGSSCAGVPHPEHRSGGGPVPGRGMGTGAGERRAHGDQRQPLQPLPATASPQRVRNCRQRPQQLDRPANRELSSARRDGVDDGVDGPGQGRRETGARTVAADRRPDTLGRPGGPCPSPTPRSADYVIVLPRNAPPHHTTAQPKGGQPVRDRQPALWSAERLTDWASRSARTPASCFHRRPR
jgi:hypothetical protein